MPKVGYPVLLDEMGGLRKIITLKNGKLARFLRWSTYNGWTTAEYSVECPVCQNINEFSVAYYSIIKEESETHPITISEYQENGEWFRHSKYCDYCGVNYYPMVR
jgi:hypothetical protein